MNWIDLQHKYAIQSDQGKFLKYSSDNKPSLDEISDVESYFYDIEAERSNILDNIMEYDFFDIEAIEKHFGKLLKTSCLQNIDILLRITAVIMLKNKPEVARAKCLETIEIKPAVLSAMPNIKNNAPPEFYYPM